MSIDFIRPEVDELRPRISVIGVGGAGGNAIANMIRSDVQGVQFLVANTDAQALNASEADQRIQLGLKITQGLGAGSRPEIGRAAAEETLDEIERSLEGAHMCFIAAGMGGGVRLPLVGTISAQVDSCQRSGDLRNPGDGYLYACSIGFNVLKGTIAGYVSAGHCGDAGEPVFLEGAAGIGPQWTLGAQIGTFQASNFPNPGQTGNDWSWIAISSGHTQSGTVYGWGKGDVAVKGSTSVGVGAAICRSGRTSGWRCGTVEALGQTVSYGTGETILNLTRTSACSEGGDSGGSFITGVGQAQGVLSGGSGSCKGGGKRSKSFFQPLAPILSAYGLTLKTG